MTTSSHPRDSRAYTSGLASCVATIPLAPMINPSFQRIVFKRICAVIPEMDVPTVKNKLVVIASSGEKPINSKIGVRIKPPPTPKNPERTLIMLPNSK